MVDETGISSTSDWAVQIGRFSMGLGGIEWAADMLLVLSEGVSKSNDFYDRLVALKASASNLKADLQIEVSGLVDEAQALRMMRNTVLHSTVAVSFYVEAAASAGGCPDLDAGRVMTMTHLNDRRGRQTDIDLAAMTALAALAEELSGRFWAALFKQDAP
ncbi:hypothetical protein N5J01_08480 [Stenotrophomonas sp. GD03701]|uniref:Uncharacterized protein n=1 Tax=Stenotrophomonas maltophilia TaxID=40324 RepID=A0A2J0SQ96_STEMA|nr:MULTISPECIES: hypothetical protein [Stenotrophomonas]MBA0311941.1 hypothetical protein [Stenotrophomonas maltophilia]MDH1388442.1 hypothetical protein [Stenotrophomonas sp. GD03701]MDH1392019.1 hypothetical protein [Stenotrophomonas sp. GD03702]MDQ7302702.1 hypothetical protein [Stenotrophomonas sp. Sm0581]PJK99444.1 hypothetical protein B9Y57_17600 [Stenotrophomonas maltophilia]